MEESQPFVAAVYAELNRRKVLRTVGAYAVAVFAILQLMDAAVEPLLLPDWLPTLLVIVLILLFPLVFLLAWRFEITSEGIRRTAGRNILTSGQRATVFGGMLLATAVLGYGFFHFYGDVLRGETPPQGSIQSYTAPDNSIAVLPFADLSESGDQAHFSDGIAEEILNLLAQVEGLHVAARTSSFAFREPQKDIREIGRLLNVSTVLEGSVRKVGNRVRLTAQLINVDDGFHIWSQSYDRELDDVFAIQDEVASAIAEALLESFTGLKLKPTDRPQNIAAFEAYRTGRLLWWRRSPQDLQQAIERFAEALQHDPQFARAYAAIADSVLLLASYGNVSPMRAIERAEPMISKALALNPESAEAFAALGLARWQIGQFDAAESALRQALRLNGDYIPAWLWLGGMLGQLGRIPEQGAVLQEAIALDPLNELLAINYATNLYVRGDYDRARSMLNDLILLKPDSVMLLRTLASYSMSHGDLVEGWTFARRSYALEPESPPVAVTMAKAWLDLGALRKAEEVVLAGLESAEKNAELQTLYLRLLLIDGRLEEAERVVRELHGENPESLPSRFQRYYYAQMALIHAEKNDWAAARDVMEQSVALEGAGLPDEAQLEALSMAALYNKQLGEAERAEPFLAEAERIVLRERVNGVDTSWIYYSEAVLHALRDEFELALGSLEAAYNRGWRQYWVLRMDKRLISLRNQPRFIRLSERMNEDIQAARREVGEIQVAQR